MVPSRSEQRGALLQAKLRTLVRDHWHVADAEPRPFPAGAGLVHVERSIAWALVDETRIERDPMDTENRTPRVLSPRGWLGGAVVWLHRQAMASHHVLLDHVESADARRLELFAHAPELWRVLGRSVEKVQSEKYVDADAPPVDMLAFAGIIEAAGAEAVVEHGVLRAEVLGLEVGRVTTSPDDGAPVLEVGVGRHDRLANQIMHAQLDSEEALRRSVDAVTPFRCAGAPSHPANQLAPERWLRAVVCAHPDLVGAAVLEPVSGTVASQFKQSTPAVAIGRDLDGKPLVVGFSTGLDLDAVVFAADARVWHAPAGARLVICVPEGDDQPVIRLLASLLREPAEIVTVARDWPALL